MLLKLKIPNGETITYREQGNGNKILLLVHGNMSSSQHFDVLLNKIPKDIKVYAVDLRGCGGSSYNNEINSLKDFSEDIKSFIDILELKDIYLCGWSTGGGISMQLSIDYPELVKGLILIESVGIMGYPIFKKDENLLPILTEALKTKEEIRADLVQVQPILNAYANKDKETLKLIWDSAIYTAKKPAKAQYEIYLDDMLTQRNLVDLDYALTRFNISHSHNGVVEGTGEIDKLKVDTLIYQGINDLIVPVTMGDGIYEAIKDNAKYIKHDGGHSPFIDDIDLLTKSILDFII